VISTLKALDRIVGELPEFFKEYNESHLKCPGLKMFPAKVIRIKRNTKILLYD
jgi:hypothetical protein